MSVCTQMLPSGLPVRPTTALFARVLPAAKLIVEASAAMPAGLTRRSPGPVGASTVTFRATATAPDGTPHWPARAKARRAPLPCSAGPPNGPLGARVSTTRHGVSVWKLETGVGASGPYAHSWEPSSVT